MGRCILQAQGSKKLSTAYLLKSACLQDVDALTKVQLRQDVRWRRFRRQKERDMIIARGANLEVRRCRTNIHLGPYERRPLSLTADAGREIYPLTTKFVTLDLIYDIAQWNILNAKAKNCLYYRVILKENDKVFYEQILPFLDAISEE